MNSYQNEVRNESLFSRTVGSAFEAVKELTHTVGGWVRRFRGSLLAAAAFAPELACTDPNSGSGSGSAEDSDSGEVVSEPRHLNGVLIITKDTVTAPELVGLTYETAVPELFELMSRYLSLFVKGGNTPAGSTIAATYNTYCGWDGQAPGSAAEMGYYDARDGVSAVDEMPPCDLGIETVVERHGFWYAFHTTNQVWQNGVTPAFYPGFDAKLDTSPRCNKKNGEGGCDPANYDSGIRNMKEWISEQLANCSEDTPCVIHTQDMGLHGGGLSEEAYGSLWGSAERDADTTGVLNDVYSQMEQCLVDFPSPPEWGGANFLTGSKDTDISVLLSELDDEAELTTVSEQFKCVYGKNFGRFNGYDSASAAGPMGVIEEALQQGLAVVVVTDHGESVEGRFGLEDPEGQQGWLKMIGHPKYLGPTGGYLAGSNQFVAILLPEGQAPLQWYAPRVTSPGVTLAVLDLLDIDPREAYNDPRAIPPTRPDFEDLRTNSNGESMVVDGHSVYGATICFEGGIKHQVLAVVDGVGTVTRDLGTTLGATDVWALEDSGGLYGPNHSAAVDPIPADLQAGFARVENTGIDPCTK